MAEIVVVARGRAKAGSESVVEEAFLEVVPPTHEEDGCLRYAFHRSADDPKQFVMIERWSSREALERHLGSPHVGRLFEKVGPLLEEPAEIMVLEPLSEMLGAKGKI